MGRLKNALRGHYVQEYTQGTETAGEEWLRLAKYISNIEDDTQEEVEDVAFYDGDGTPEATVMSVAGAYTAEGHYDPKDPAQALIASLKYTTGNGRKIWHKVVSADGLMEFVGRATATEIVAGAGEASEFEEFSCNLRFDTLPKQTPIVEG